MVTTRMQGMVGWQTRKFTRKIGTNFSRSAGARRYVVIPGMAKTAVKKVSGHLVIV